MKRTFISALIIAVIAAFAAPSVPAQEKHNSGEDWKKKMMSEKVAFFTVELDLTPEEAQMFWPVYNKMEKAKDEAQGALFKAFIALEKGIGENKPKKEIENLLEAYLKALDNQKNVDKKAAEAFKDVLPIEKVAKLYVGEETFRRQYIRRLHGGPGGKGR